jgi:hypothetical protein
MIGSTQKTVSLNKNNNIHIHHYKHLPNLFQKNLKKNKT